MHCLVVDPNVAFATLLKQELAQLGHTVDVCTSGPNALALAQSSPPDLVLLDMGLEVPGALELGRQLRTGRPDVRLMLIPMMGEEPVLGDDAPAIQGVLPKPFFLPELPDRIAAALAAPIGTADWHVAPEPRTIPQAHRSSEPESMALGMTTRDVLGSAGGVSQESLDADALAALAFQLGNSGAASSSEGLGDAALDWLADLDPLDAVVESPAETTADPGAVVSPVDGEDDELAGEGVRAAQGPSVPEPAQGLSRRAFRMNQGRIETVMRELVAEVGADGVILTCDTGVLTAVGGLDEDEIESISSAVLSGSRTSAEMAKILGREQLRFEQSIAGGSYLLYALGIHDAILAVTVRGDTPLGLLRHRARATAERIADLCT